MGINKILLAVLIPLLFGSCSTDFDTIADYKETVVVYGLLDQLSNEQLIKINKAYLGEGNALLMAQEKDSINYADILNVSMEEIDGNGNVLATFSLLRDTSFLKDSGMFNYPFQVIYKLVGQQLHINSNYRLKVKNTQTGLEAKSTTSLLGNINLKTPGASQKFNFTLPVNFSVQYAPASGAKIYNLTLRFHYTETNIVSGLTTDKYVDWFLPDEVVDINATNDMKFIIPREDFYKVLGANIPVDPDMVRHVGNPDVAGGFSMEVRITSGSENLYKYMQLTTPSSSIVQERPPFSNIENGVGLFTGRSLFSTFRDLDDPTKNSLDTSIYTRDLNFQ